MPRTVLTVGLHSALSPAENAILARYTPLRWRNRVFGIKFVISQGIASGGVALVAIIYDTTGSLDASFLIFAGLAALVALLLPRDPALAAVERQRWAAAAVAE
ncbi:MAG: hypothetical protein EXQ91_04435 [Alphaproteobacteria bacterium]|nr:hypothetical protein [Alphaproteobacteria bacterium]